VKTPLEEVAEYVVKNQVTTPSTIQRHLRVGAVKVQQLLAELELLGVVSTAARGGDAGSVGAAHGRRSRAGQGAPVRVGSVGMSYESRAYDRSNSDGFPADPVVVLVVTGTHDVSRLVNLLNGGQPVVEQLRLRDRIVRQVKRHNAGRGALELLRAHGGPDFTEEAGTDA
jgi:hypothetical protein